MSREIKFRVRRKEKDGWRIYAESSIIDLWNGSNPSLGVMQKELTAYENGELIFLEYTGLKDKNGKEIYEGDIVQLYRHSDDTHKHEKAKAWKDGRYHNDIKEVKFLYGSFVVWSDLIQDYRCFANLWRPGESLEIIGNIYENPELIK